MLSKPICCELFTLLSEVPVNSFVFGAVQTTNRDSEKAVSELVAPQWALESGGGEGKRKREREKKSVLFFLLLLLKVF